MPGTPGLNLLTYIFACAKVVNKTRRHRQIDKTSYHMQVNNQLTSLIYYNLARPSHLIPSLIILSFFPPPSIIVIASLPT